MKTLAAVLFKLGSPLELIELEIPSLKQGQVLVKIIFSGACGTQLAEIKGEKGPDKWLPHCLGHEAVGEVIDTGSSVTKVEAGDLVVLTWLKGNGMEAGGSQYSSCFGPINAGAVSTFQKHSVVSENRVYKISSNHDLRLSVLLGCSAPTGMGAVNNVLKIKKGETVVIFGAGGVGLQACLAAKEAEASEICVVDPVNERLSLAKTFGATQVKTPKQFYADTRSEAFAQNNYDCAVEASGKSAVILNAVDSIRPQGGRLVVIGNSPHGEYLTLDPKVFNEGKSLLGTWGGNSHPELHFEQLYEILKKNKKTSDTLLASSFSLSKINDALQLMADGQVGRPLIDMNLEG